MIWYIGTKSSTIICLPQWLKIASKWSHEFNFAAFTKNETFFEFLTTVLIFQTVTISFISLSLPVSFYWIKSVFSDFCSKVRKKLKWKGTLWDLCTWSLERVNESKKNVPILGNVMVEWEYYLCNKKEGLFFYFVFFFSYLES